ncbi:hemolysin III [Arenimonas maotaiensis]|uniref:Hemolysin III n=1 Tax=Arenimonas maotaiensis TaxID=1446479 RepID=A0A917FMZ5_9GAMM|nr:hemolysin III family protein [Arenimonas maotaiensis]MCC6756393.1 hemolysin III family protein [Arenimonas sp.]GGF90391.1 hemolysin III [Arenimonas maotaiensis]
MNAEHLRAEFWNALTHGAGAVLSLIGGAVLVTLASLYGNGWQLTGAIVFSLSLIGLYTASTLYHAVHEPKAKGRLKVLDHCMIYVLIAGSYTPFALIALRGDGGWLLFGTIWTLAAAGIVFKLFFTGRFELLSTLVYLAMGWLVVFAAGPMLRHVGTTELVWLGIGGLFYSLGTVFYLWERLRHNHAIWHGFVLAGSASHFVAISYLVL